MKKLRRIGILTAGGDCAGLNAVIRAVVKSGLRQHPAFEVVGILDGYAGLVEGRTRLLSENDVSGILPRGGTILGTSNRDNPFKYISAPGRKPKDRSQDAVATVRRLRLEGLLAVGGDGTLRCALELLKKGIPVIGIPKTIDNDLNGTDVTFGFDTALMVATEAIDRLHTTAESHHRVLICEVMGRYAGWIALRAGTAGGGDVILIPEIPYRIDSICQAITQREKRGRRFSIIVVAEGAKPLGGQMTTQGTYKEADKRPQLGGIGHTIARALEKQTGDETRVVILGHVQRGGTPTAHDRWLATHFGFKAIELAASQRWGNMVNLRGTQFSAIPIEQAVGTLHRVDPLGEEVRAARAVGTSFGDNIS
ncbi:MAG: ATP-dependent 6-phosphofructokinase [Elusimicrobiota bacterium]|jgi:6-phosphofructokinase 1